MRTAAALASLTSIGLLAGALVGTGADPPPAAQVEQGREIYERCAACHSLERDRVGPRHCGLFGRHAGSIRGFVYSDAMRASGIVWNRKTLNWFLTNPLEAVPGTLMGYAGIPDPEERARLIDYLEVATRGKECRAATAGSGP